MFLFLWIAFFRTHFYLFCWLAFFFLYVSWRGEQCMILCPAYQYFVSFKKHAGGIKCLDWTETKLTLLFVLTHYRSSFSDSGSEPEPIWAWAHKNCSYYLCWYDKDTLCFGLDPCINIPSLMGDVNLFWVLVCGVVMRFLLSVIYFNTNLRREVNIKSYEQSIFI